jgi:hypothetical protein
MVIFHAIMPDCTFLSLEPLEENAMVKLLVFYRRVTGSLIHIITLLLYHLYNGQATTTFTTVA